MKDLAASVTGRSPHVSKRRRLRHLSGLFVVLAVIFFVPAAISRFIVGGDWLQTLVSYAIWLGLLFLGLIVPRGGTATEKGGWFVIMAMFTTIFAVPVITLVQRLGGWILFELN